MINFTFGRSLDVPNPVLDELVAIWIETGVPDLRLGESFWRERSFKGPTTSVQTSSKNWYRDYWVRLVSKNILCQV